ncbi:MAG: ABC transporter substrate-binding protein [Oligoflexales bacterium]|nr:ABC transporter substrate-binding protein [Oligoflexales bacterium]
MKRILRLATFAFLLSLFIPSGLVFAEDKPVSVTFINPGASDAKHTTGDFWLLVSTFMQAAAKSLGFELEILYGERKFEPMEKHAKDIAARPKKPDYIVIVNEKDVGPRLLDILKDTGSKIFIMSNDLKPDQYKDVGLPREKIKNLIGSMVSDNVYAGEAMMESLVKAAKSLPAKKNNLLIVSGDRATPASLEREEGLKKVLEKHKGKIEVKQTVYGEWREDKAYDASKALFPRYPDIDMVFAANDPIAFGAIKAMTEAGKKPGKDILVTGLNWSQDALKKIKEGEMVSSAGGHFMTGGWALVMLYDYHRGKDFGKNGEYRLRYKIFDIIDKGNLPKWEPLLQIESWDKIDFKKYTKTHNPKLKDYDFRLLKK